MRVSVRGTTYESVREASEVLGVCMSTVYAALCRGDTDRLGLGRGNHGRHNVHHLSTSVTIGPTTYPSMRQASRELGIPRKRLTRWARAKGITTRNGEMRE